MNELISCMKNLPKHFKTAVQNIWRNGVMSFSSIFAVTITLVLIGVIGVLALNVQDISSNIEEGVSIYVKLDRYIDEAAEQAVGPQIEAISGVKKITYYTKDQELDKLIETQGDEGAALFESYRADNPLGGAYEVEVDDAANIAKIAEKIQEIPNVNKTSYGGQSTQDMVKTLKTIQTGGSIFIVGLAIIALFMIANTIKITITAR
ncbi:MAG: permease-like cell division protein FtsX [Thomasclavelia ramosa]|nr:permease-like cell division protein FtsX [Thomasclavelia ramosa]